MDFRRKKKSLSSCERKKSTRERERKRESKRVNTNLAARMRSL